ncbi:hypothetical protein VOLCADRAFT_95196 [Volvox carteri f. nagariensis]|uniref:Mitochondrial transcription termination factor n=1 Tax=Volvox carteri f. nagariensis TaxID=3068 RepID=D8U6V6_VOLCA|nr:uncharacterized protein VOLCADRAFT_95196 [Volvox carteri f. nagariensis]EFJ44578.1 hypothetical protein VOLCADRAFT_95196 [Volvox carteri f. nagariensis]|eukprot:XP_002954428.1 hypothetical protein VOLCADRAFT_95196 [Volvox carteri f. nagariensis]
MPASVREHLEDLGIPAETFRSVGDINGLSRNAEPALATLTSLTSRQRLKTLLLSNPQLLCVPLGVWLDFLTAYGMSRQDFFALLGAFPELFTLGSLFKAGNAIAYLQSLGLTPRDVVSSVILRNPGVLLSDVHTGLEPAVEFLRQGLGLGQEDVRDFLCRCPRVLSLDPVRDLAPCLELLCSAGLERGVARRLLLRNGALLTRDLPSEVHLRLSFLTSHCGFSAGQAALVLQGCPEMLSFTTANLSRKWRFLTEKMAGGREQPPPQTPVTISLQMLLDSDDDLHFLERVWVKKAAAAAAAAAPTEGFHRTKEDAERDDWGNGEEESGRCCGRSGGGDGGCRDDSPGAELGLKMGLQVRVGVGEGAGMGALWDAEAVLSDFRKFRTAWLEREGARWTGVRSVGVTGSW